LRVAAIALVFGLFPAVPEAGDRGTAVHRPAGHADTGRGKSVQPMQAHKPPRHAPPADPQAQNPGRGCLLDDGGGRVRPCSEAGSGGGGGGGGGGGM
jgi:hypothetical protein